MCGRFTLRTNPAEFSELYQRDLFGSWSPRYNIAPSQSVASIRVADDQTELVGLRWGLIPSWSKDMKIGYRMINARSETIAEKPSFRSAFKRRRCLVLADGYYEWKKLDNRDKQPIFITMRDDEPFTFAGLWESWRGTSEEPLDEPLESCTIITTDSNELTADVHDRMPVILRREDYDFWLDPAFDGTEKLLKMLQPFDSDEMKLHAVSTLVNKPINDSPECIKPAVAS